MASATLEPADDARPHEALLVNILGISCYYHDAAACLYSDGGVVAAAEEERFSRRKHDQGFPAQAISYVLRESGASIRDVDFVVFYEKPLVKFERILAMCAEGFPGALDHFVPAMQSWLSEKLWVPARIRRDLAYRGLILYAEHHLSHAASAYYCSPFDEAAVLTMDAIGEWASTTIGYGRGLDLEVVKEIRFPNSLGLLYSAFTAYLGFEVNEGEYKVMGMAAYGRARYADQIRRIVQIAEDGSFGLDMTFFGYHRSLRPWTQEFERLFGPPCVASSDSSNVNERCADIAASIQLVTEEAIIALAREAHRVTGSGNLCIAGGVAQNVLANRRVALETPFARVYVPPAPGDSGGAIGAAAYVWHAVLRRPRVAPLETSQLGPAYSSSEIRAFLDRRAIPYRRLGDDEILNTVADMIAEGKVVGWFQGRMEFGPRALGGRSILANACDPTMKDIVNAKIKHREPFRPFAPSVVAERSGAYFEDVGESPFMSFLARVRPDARTLLPAVTHVDGTARVQTVAADQNPLYYGLLLAVEKRLGVPIVLNTSFNVRGEPIVCSPADAFRSFSHTDMDALVLGPFLVGAEAKRKDEPYPGVYAVPDRKARLA